MKSARTIVALLIGLVLGTFVAGHWARVAVLSGPYSDNYGPARTEIAHAVAKLKAGDTNVIEHLTAADAEIERAQQWSRRFLGHDNER